MRRKLTIEYDGSESLSITLIESAIKNIHESAGGKLINICNEENNGAVNIKMDMVFDETAKGA